jgi:transcriptional regulator with XRE-family HTH domain
MFDVPLGDLMRGERATLGKSLLDVERELRIRATYIAAIENGDIGAFQSAGFIAGYVRSYARYLGMEPEWTFQRFCEETGFRGVHGGASGQRRRAAWQSRRRFGSIPNDVMRRAPKMLAPTPEPWLSRLEPGALGSIAVLLVLAAGIGYGAWAILQDVQRLSIAPVDDAPAPLAQLDPLAGATEGAFDMAQGFDIAVPGRRTPGGSTGPSRCRPRFWRRATRRWRRSTPTRSARSARCARRAARRSWPRRARECRWRGRRRCR